MDQIIGQMNIFDFLGNIEMSINPWEEYAKRGSGFQNGKIRIRNFFAQETTKSKRAKFLKEEYGIGGFAAPRTDKSKFHLHSGDTGYGSAMGRVMIGYFLPYSDEEIIEYKSFSELVDVIDNLIAKNEY